MSFEGLQERLAALQETTAQLKELIDRLANLKFQPRSVPLNIEEENSVSGELSAEIGLLLRNGLEDQQLLYEEAKYIQPAGDEKTRLEEGIAKVGAELLSYRSALRKARLSAKKSLDEAHRLERALMVQSFAEPFSDTNTPTAANDDDNDDEAAAPPIPRAPRYTHHHQQQLQSSLTEEERQTVGTSSNVTNALRRTHALIAAELTRSEFAHQTLTESSDALKKLDESYNSLDGMLASSRDLLGTLLRSQKSDTWYLQTAMYMLLVTGAWLVFRRLLYGPLWWLVWLPLRVIFGVGTKAGGALLSKRGGGVSESGKPGVAADGKIAVDGLPDESLPTVRVGKGSTAAEADPDSLVDKVGKIIDAMNDGDEPRSTPEEREARDGQEIEQGISEDTTEDSHTRDEL